MQAMGVAVAHNIAVELGAIKSPLTKPTLEALCFAEYGSTGVESKEFIIQSLKLYRRYDMTTKLVTQSLKTGKLTAMSNVTSITVTGHQISILEDQPQPGKKDCSAVHLTFDVEHPQKLPSLLATAEELGLIMDRDDAIEISLSLLAMALEDKTTAEIEAVEARLANTIAQLHRC